MTSMVQKWSLVIALGAACAGPLQAAVLLPGDSVGGGPYVFGNAITFDLGSGVTGLSFSSTTAVNAVLQYSSNGLSNWSLVTAGTIGNHATDFFAAPGGVFADSSGGRDNYRVLFFLPQDRNPGYRVEVTAVPEPAEWALLIGGLGLVGWSAARRRKAA